MVPKFGEGHVFTDSRWSVNSKQDNQRKPRPRLIIVKFLKTEDKESGDRGYCIQFSAARCVFQQWDNWYRPGHQPMCPLESASYCSVWAELQLPKLQKALPRLIPAQPRAVSPFLSVQQKGQPKGENNLLSLGCQKATEWKGDPGPSLMSPLSACADFSWFPKPDAEVCPPSVSPSWTAM